MQKIKTHIRLEKNLSNLACYEVVLGKQAVQKLKVIPMSANTAKRRIEEWMNILKIIS